MKDDQERPKGDLVLSSNRGLARASGLVRRGLDDLVRRQEIEARPQQPDRSLKNQAGMRRKNPEWPLIEHVIGELDTGYGNSFCCLETSHGYIQVLRGYNGYHLERRITNGTGSGGYAHYRASYPGGSSEVVELRKHDGYGNPGEHRDLLQIDDVLDAFRAFYRGDSVSASLDWRILDI